MQTRPAVLRIMKATFGKEPVVSGNTAKVNVKEISTGQIYELYRMSLPTLTDDVKLKRSGTGITVIITLKP